MPRTASSSSPSSPSPAIHLSPPGAQVVGDARARRPLGRRRLRVRGTEAGLHRGRPAALPGGPPRSAVRRGDRGPQAPRPGVPSQAGGQRGGTGRRPWSFVRSGALVDPAPGRGCGRGGSPGPIAWPKKSRGGEWGGRGGGARGQARGKGGGWGGVVTGGGCGCAVFLRGGGFRGRPGGPAQGGGGGRARRPRAAAPARLGGVTPLRGGIPDAD